MSRRHYFQSGAPLPDVPFAKNLVFYAPLTEGDLTDHVSGVAATVASTATVQWDSAKGMYHIYTGVGGSSSYLKTISWDNLPNLTSFPNGITLYLECEEVSGECSGNSYAGTMSVASMSSSTQDVAYICNYRYTNVTGFYTLVPHAKLAYTLTSSGSCIWYKDGVSVRTASGWTNRIFNGSISVCQLHRNNTKYGIYAKDVRVYNRVLSASEVAQL